jgi:hypothetical protein
MRHEHPLRGKELHQIANKLQWAALPAWRQACRQVAPAAVAGAAVTTNTGGCQHTALATVVRADDQQSCLLLASKRRAFSHQLHERILQVLQAGSAVQSIQA